MAISGTDEQTADRFTPENITTVFIDKFYNKTGKGIDGVDSSQFFHSLGETSGLICKKISDNRYRYSPYIEILKLKGRGKPPRIISKPTIRDKIVLSILKDELHDQFPDSVTRKLPNVHIRELSAMLQKQETKNLYFLKIDIKNFYDSIPREKLLSQVGSIVKNDHTTTLIRRAITNKTVPQNYRKKNSDNYSRDTGIPQGLAISNILANIYLQEFDKKFLSSGLVYIRYVDDILIISEQDETEDIKDKINEEMALLGLEIHSGEKSESGPIPNHFDFLGYSIEYSKISVRKSTEERFIASLAGMFTDFKHNSNRRKENSKWLDMEQIKDIFILRLNEKITGAISEDKRYGWLFYFLEINDMSLLHKIDSIIQSMFTRLDAFNQTPPKTLKSIVKSFYEAKHHPMSGYIHNYNNYKSASDKLSYLVKMGLIAKYDEKKYSEDDIDHLFNKVKRRHIVKLEEDLGSLS